MKRTGRQSRIGGREAWVMGRESRWVWVMRVGVAVVCGWNLTAAIPFVLAPADYIASFEVTGVGGEALVRGMGILFLMWQVPFVPVILEPARHRACLVCVLVMQAIGLAGESWMLSGLPTGHAALRATGWRFVAFDGAGLVILAAITVVGGMLVLRLPNGCQAAKH
jgi:hypothetical protein